MKSIETIAALFADRAARQAWHRHLVSCSRCGAASKRGATSDPCPEGAKLRAESREAAADLKRNRELDRQPSSDQEPLF